MKLFILNGACQDDAYIITLETPRVFNTREDALKALEETYNSYSDRLSGVMDSDLDLELGVADFYVEDHEGEDPYEYIYQISEVEVN